MLSNGVIALAIVGGFVCCRSTPSCYLLFLSRLRCCCCSFHCQVVVGMFVSDLFSKYENMTRVSESPPSSELFTSSVESGRELRGTSPPEHYHCLFHTVVEKEVRTDGQTHDICRVRVSVCEQQNKKKHALQ